TKADPDVYVLGDSSAQGDMPNSGFSANSQAKVCAAAIVAALAGESLPAPSYANTCYSLVGPDYGISVSAVYRLEAGAITAVAGAGGVSPSGVGPEFRAREARYTRGWYASITTDSFG
ncbi:MAG: FCSD flavin-binding domain-containing protein, partial [Candidatus Competibacterales bacterium]|nr:FCSD flavin-binding domain-containing protein [Candidatus Competibacterales bacterium]